MLKTGSETCVLKTAPVLEDPGEGLIKYRQIDDPSGLLPKEQFMKGNSTRTESIIVPEELDNNISSRLLLILKFA
jgi:hypothetical protein